MAEKKNYRISQIEGKITWQLEELWDGGQVRGPYGTKEAAIGAAKKIAEENGYLDDLVLQEAAGAKMKPEASFKKDSEGNWLCTQGCSIEIENKELVFTQGMSFSKGIPFMGVDVVGWLEENIKT